MIEFLLPTSAHARDPGLGRAKLLAYARDAAPVSEARPRLRVLSPWVRETPGLCRGVCRTGGPRATAAALAYTRGGDYGGGCRRPAAGDLTRAHGAPGDTCKGRVGKERNLQALRLRVPAS